MYSFVSFWYDRRKSSIELVFFAQLTGSPTVKSFVDLSGGNDTPPDKLLLLAYRCHCDINI